MLARTKVKTRMAARLSTLLLIFSFAFNTHAEVYKWTDANGQTHYSERKADAGTSKTEEVKIPPAPEPPKTSTPSADYLRAPSKFAPPAQPSAESDHRPAKRPTSLSDGQDHGTDASRCALARDISSGAVRHSSGKKTDQYDREVAQNDIKAFCSRR